MKPLGYIVCNGATGMPEKMVGGILWMGSFAHIFSTNELARRAILRTQRYAVKNGYTRDEWLSKAIIVPIQPLSTKEEMLDQRMRAERTKRKQRIDYEQIRLLIKAGSPHKNIADAYGISISEVSRIKHGTRGKEKDATTAV